jgi:hypothetical protein
MKAVMTMLLNAKQLLTGFLVLVLAGSSEALADKRGGGGRSGGNSGAARINAGNGGGARISGNMSAAIGSRPLKAYSGAAFQGAAAGTSRSRTKMPTVNPGLIANPSRFPNPGKFQSLTPLNPGSGPKPTFPPIVGQKPTKPINPTWPTNPGGFPTTPPINPNPPTGNPGGHGHGHHHHNWYWHGHAHWNLWTRHVGSSIRCPIVTRPCALPCVGETVVVTQPVVVTLPQVYAANELDLAVREVRVLRPADATRGTLFQVFVNNNGPSDLTQNTRLALFGVGDAAPDENTPSAIKSFTGLKAGDTTIIEVEMPVSVTRYDNLLVAVEVPEGVVDINESNNLAQGEIARLPMATAGL